MTTEPTVKRWQDRIDLASATMTDRREAMFQEIAELRAQVAQYKEDAERYRWLRDTNLDAGVRATGEHLEPLQVPMIFIGHPEDQWTLGSFASAWVGEKFDRAIDAAIDKARQTT